MFQNRELIQSKRTGDLPSGKSSQWQLYEKKSPKNKAVWYSRRDGGQEISKLPLEKDQCSSCKEKGHWKKIDLVADKISTPTSTNGKVIGLGFYLLSSQEHGVTFKVGNKAIDFLINTGVIQRLLGQLPDQKISVQGATGKQHTAPGPEPILLTQERRQ